MTSPIKTRIKVQTYGDGSIGYTAQVKWMWFTFWTDIDSYGDETNLESAQAEIDVFLERNLRYTKVGKPTYIKYP